MSALLRRKIGLESIDFQSGLFHSDLTDAIGRLRKTGTPTTKDILDSGISGIIKRHTGMKMDLYIQDGICNAHAMIPAVDKNHPLINDEWKTARWPDGLTALDVIDGTVAGTVNLKTSMVGGIFSKFNNRIGVGLLLFKDSRYTDAEISSILLHEIGHIFYYYAYLGYIYRTNLVMATTIRAFNEVPDIKERKLILERAQGVLGVDLDDLSGLAATKHKGVIETVFISETARRMRSELGENLYDARSFEKLADEFAARHGAARDLATALDKYWRVTGNIAARSTATYLIFEIAKLTLFACSLVALPPVAIGLAVLGYPGGEIYDEPKVRVDMIKRQLTTALKDKNLPDDRRTSILEDIEVVKDVESDLIEHRTFYRYLVEAIFPARRRMRRQIEIQKDIEKLAANDLYIAAAKFRGA